MIQLEKPLATGTMPVVWPTILDLGRDECKRILRKLGKADQKCSVCARACVCVCDERDVNSRWTLRVDNVNKAACSLTK